MKPLGHGSVLPPNKVRFSVFFKVVISSGLLSANSSYSSLVGYKSLRQSPLKFGFFRSSSLQSGRIVSVIAADPVGLMYKNKSSEFRTDSENNFIQKIIFS